MKVEFAASQFTWSQALGAPADELSIDRLYRAHAQEVFEWALRLGASRADSQDTVQEVFLRAQAGLHTVRTENLSAWLFGITRKVLAHHRQKERRRARLDEEKIDPTLGSGAAEDQTERFHSIARVNRVLARLREPERVALVLFELEELSGEKSAELMGLKPAAFWPLLHRARRHFRARLHEEAREG